VNAVNGFFGVVDPDGFDTALFRVDPSFGSSFDTYWLTEMGISTTAIPEPSTSVLFGFMLLTLIGHRRRRF